MVLNGIMILAALNGHIFVFFFIIAGHVTMSWIVAFIVSAEGKEDWKMLNQPEGVIYHGF